jgi:glutamate formiminotransferase
MEEMSNEMPEIPSFLPEETMTKPKRQSFKALKIGNESMIFKTRFWSPDR